jgi:predicted nuclease with TOPRIM domain
MNDEGGNVSDLTLEVLKGIRGELQGLRTDVTGLRTDVTGLRTELHDGLGELRMELRTGLEAVRAEVHEVRGELHQLAEYTQAGFTAVLRQTDRRYFDHEGRLRALEEHTGLTPRRG